MSPVPPPVPSPAPNYDEPCDTPSGLHKLSAHELRLIRESDALEAKAQTRKMKTSSSLKALLAAVGGVAVAFVEHRTDNHFEPRVAAVEAQQTAVMAELGETRQDLRELYKAQLHHQPSARLEAPVPKPDGGE